MVSSADQPQDDRPHGGSRGPLVDGLSARQERTIICLLDEPTLPKAAQAAGVGERTLHRWLTLPAFMVAYRRARREAFGHAIAVTQKYAPHAVNTLVKLMADNATPAHVRVTAAATILKFGREGIELDDLAARVEALEQATTLQPHMNGHGRWGR